MSSESPQISSTQTPVSAASRGFLHDAWAAVKGTREDYTSGSLSRAITLLAIPMMLELVMESTFGLVDIYFVGKLGADAVATVGLSASVLVILFAVALGLSMGATALVARRIGEGDPEGAGLSAVQAIFAGVFFSVPLALAGIPLAPQLLAWMGGSPEVVAGSSYLAMLLAGSITIFLIFLNNAIFRGAGDAAIGDAGALAGEHHQHDSRPLSDLRLGAVPGDGSAGRGGCDHDRPRHRRRLPNLGAA